MEYAEAGVEDGVKESTQANLPQKRKIDKEAVFGYISIIIPLFGFVFFSGFPLVISFIVQFCDIDYFDLTSLTWNNFATFKAVFSDDLFFKSIYVTLWVASAQLVSLGIALLTSVLLSKKVWGSKVFQVLFFVPYVCSSVAVSIMWIWMFNEDFGIINDILVRLFGEGARVRWFNDTKAYTWMIFIVTVWQAPGYGIVMYKAALASVDPALYEAAQMDGANGFQQFWKITLPAIAPTTFYLLMSGVIAGLLSFDIPKMFSGDNWTGEAGPDYMGLTLVLYIYNKGTKFNDMPAASVMSWVLFVITFIVSFILFKLRNREEKAR